MKITLVREEKESGREAVSTCEADVLLERIKTETKAAHVTALRTMLLYTTPDAQREIGTAYGNADIAEA